MSAAPADHLGRAYPYMRDLERDLRSEARARPGYRATACMMALAHSEAAGYDLAAFQMPVETIARSVLGVAGTGGE